MTSVVDEDVRLAYFDKIGPQPSHEDFERVRRNSRETKSQPKMNPSIKKRPRISEVEKFEDSDEDGGN